MLKTLLLIRLIESKDEKTLGCEIAEGWPIIGGEPAEKL